MAKRLGQKGAGKDTSESCSKKDDDKMHCKHTFTWDNNKQNQTMKKVSILYIFSINIINIEYQSITPTFKLTVFLNWLEDFPSEFMIMIITCQLVGNEERLNSFWAAQNR